MKSIRGAQPGPGCHRLNPRVYFARQGLRLSLQGAQTRIHTMMNAPKFKQAITRFLVLIPLLWSGGAWHDTYQVSHLDHSSAVYQHGAMAAPSDVAEADFQTSTTSDDVSVLVEAASHCESGACTGVIDTRTMLANLYGSNREIARNARRSEYIHPPLTPPPIFTS